MPFDLYARPQTNDPGTAIPGQGPAAGLQPVSPFVIKVPLTAGAGTALDIAVVMPMKAKIVDAFCITTTTVTSAVAQVFTAITGGGTALTSSMAAAAAGTTRNALVALPTAVAAGATFYVRQSGGATLSGGEVYLTCIPEA
jgi:hypothetical protein